ncbi:putative O-glycosylation ligase, exosortase A system-associated [Pseudorhodoferax sp.]|uniref:putative O-glycosylation ligase, exosortase A system-associated n=1 Tax=Pseudorhodoferax sp. TaxID=1993553 RepID=UPI002DD685BE|nr:putative O-glycosylation ligase, exosortase A system-associated [Pseudorhodoferax sp.]
MRDIALTMLFVAVLPFAVRHAYAGVLLWTWISIMNPHKLTWGFATHAPFAAVAAGVTLMSLVITKDRLKFKLTPPILLLVLFVVWMCITTALAFNPAGSWVQLNKVLKIQLMTLIAIAAIQSKKHIELFVWVNALSVAFFGIKGGIYTISTGGGGRVWGPPGGFIEGNNELGLALIMTIPLLVFLRGTVDRPWIRKAMMMAIVLCAVSAIGTQSRGAMLAIAAMGFVLWLRSRSKMLSGIVIVVLAIGLVAFMPESWTQRMGTIQTYEEDGSAMGRINAWHMTTNVANDRLTGGGFAVYSRPLFAIYAPNPDIVRVAHSIYFSVLGEHGYIGLFLFLAIWVAALRMAADLRKRARGVAELQWVHMLASMCQVSLVGYAVGGAFLSLAYFDLPYNVFVILVVLKRWMDEKRWEQDKEGVFPISLWRKRAPHLVGQRVGGK